MEWYYESEDLDVPQDKEIFDRLPSPGSWSSWGNMIGNFNSKEKLNVLGVEEHMSNGIMFSGGAEKHKPSSICQGSRRTFLQRSAYPRKYSYDELNDLPVIDAADDIFFDSIFKVDARALEKTDSSANCTQTSSEDDTMTNGDLLGGWNPIQDANHFLSEKELESEISLSEEQTHMHEDSNEEYVSMEEPILLELQRLTMQLADKTRICFRDSLFRLAENSRNQTKYGWNGEDDMENCKLSNRLGPSSARKPKAKNSDTNAIDRTVATLLFDCNANADIFYQGSSHLYNTNSSTSSPCSRGGESDVRHLA